MANRRKTSAAPAPSDHRAALEQYRRRAGVYDYELLLFEPIRRQAIERLALRPGDVVLDVGCGTGLSLPLLQQGIGDQGRIVGIEQSPEMIARARQRVQQHGWKNVHLLAASAEQAKIPVQADAALFHFTHDILRQPSALANIFQHLKPGARVVACGLQWAGARAWPINLLVLPAALRSVTSLEGLGKPWSHLEQRVRIQRVESELLGAVFVVSGIVPSGS